MNIEPKKTEVFPAKKENIPTDPSSPQINPSFNPGEPIEKTAFPDVETDRRDYEKKYGYENEYNTI